MAAVGVEEGGGDDEGFVWRWWVDLDDFMTFEPHRIDYLLQRAGTGWGGIDDSC